jgi:imidazole glycerol-phosphate synthase subunit HisH
MNKLNITIIDYGVGNTQSISNAIKYLGYNKIKISNNREHIKRADVLLLPGVGAFEEAINNLKQHNLKAVLDEEVLVNKKPILGICVGMQMLCEGSEENGWHNGLGWMDGRVKKLDLPQKFAVPHVGWNNITVKVNTTCFARNGDNPNFYFDHSYHFECTNDLVIASCDYGIKVTAAVQQGNICGVQFHPEKSQVNGLKFFRGYFNSI